MSKETFEEWLSNKKDWLPQFEGHISELECAWNHRQKEIDECNKTMSRQLTDIKMLHKKNGSLANKLEKAEKVNKELHGFICDWKEYQTRNCDCDISESCYSCFLYDRMDEYAREYFKNKDKIPNN